MITVNNKYVIGQDVMYMDEDFIVVGTIKGIRIEVFEGGRLFIQYFVHSPKTAAAWVLETELFREIKL